MDDLDNIYKKEDNIVFRHIAEEYILVPVKQKAADLNYIYVLNEVGGLIWDLIDGRKNIAWILENILAIYDVDKNTLKDDLLVFIRQLRKIDALREINAQ